ncbi:hypothetical protein GGX14DRAFT_407614 [Mycena pura]|uniref:Uncharacterized protein n=1 Tax=Mycena pura TaxID=153505 RepID=A0AAD6XWZ1_9AGAR|nr:hypothetical protein GGX14DRAFT_407614 [Mycena pura]
MPDYFSTFEEPDETLINAPPLQIPTNLPEISSAGFISTVPSLASTSQVPVAFQNYVFVDSSQEPAPARLGRPPNPDKAILVSAIQVVATMHVQIVEFQHVLGGAEICQMFHVEEVGFWIVLGTSFCFNGQSLTVQK